MEKHLEDYISSPSTPSVFQPDEYSEMPFDIKLYSNYKTKTTNYLIFSKIPSRPSWHIHYSSNLRHFVQLSSQMKMKGLDFISCGLSDIKSAEIKREYNTAFICFVEDHKSPCTFSPFLSKPPGLYCNKLPSRKQLNHFCRADSSYTRGIFFSLFIQTSRKFRHTFILLYFSYYPVPFHNFFSLFHCPIGIHSAAFARTPQFFIPGKLGRCRSSYYVYFYCAKPRNPVSIFYSVIPSAP